MITEIVSLAKLRRSIVVRSNKRNISLQWLIRDVAAEFTHFFVLNDYDD